MWTGGPALHVALEAPKVLHPLLAAHLVPVRQRRQGGVVKDDELRPPRGEVEARDVLPKLLPLNAETDDALPVRHATSVRAARFGHCPRAPRSPRRRPTVPWR